MNSPGGPSITRLKAVRKQVSDAASAAANTATQMAMASAMANHAASQAADTKAAVDDAYTAAIKLAKARNAAQRTGTPHININTTNPTTIAMSTPRATTNDDDSTRQSPIPRPTQPEDNSILFQLITVLAKALYFLLCTTWALGTVFFTWKVLMFAGAAARSLEANDMYLALFCTAFTLSFATGAWLRASRRKVPRSWA